jgi:phosphate starvation-inducible PhoH-like protein
MSKRKTEFHLQDSSFRKRIKPLTKHQQEIIDSFNEKIITIITGPAGSGKTYLPVYLAVRMLLEGKITKLVITRPAVECGEKLGHLPGELYDKIHPYLKPILDILSEFLSTEEIEECLTRKIIEVVPLAYGRGLTFKNAVAILSEAQNASKEQILMFLTRLGENSKLIIEGDINQSDIRSKENPLDFCIDVLDNIEEIGIVELTEDDIIRHPLIKKILRKWYECN